MEGARPSEEDFRILEQSRSRPAEQLRAEQQKGRALERSLAHAQDENARLLRENGALIDYYEEVVARMAKMRELERRAAALEMEKLHKAHELNQLQLGPKKERVEHSLRGSLRLLKPEPAAPREARPPSLVVRSVHRVQPGSAQPLGASFAAQRDEYQQINQ